jgi:hypothetical protein
VLPCLLLPGLGGTAVIERFHCAQTMPHEASTQPAEPKAPIEPTLVEPVAAAVPAPSSMVAIAPPKDPRAELREYLTRNLPEGGAIVEDDGPTLGVVHTCRAGETAYKIAASYVDLTTAYTNKELAAAIYKANSKLPSGELVEGTKVVIPRIVTSAPKSPSEARLPWPEDRSLRGLYANSMYAGSVDLPASLDTMAAHGMNAIVVDAKDVTGLFTYKSKIPLALELDASKHSQIPSLARLVRVAHARDIRVVARIACFRDEWVGPRRTELAVQAKGGGAHRAPSKIIDWLDPANEQVQTYLVAVVDEAIAAGVDEIQLDYVRYPTEGIGNADFKLKERGLTAVSVITDFVKRVHETTKKANVPLSLDVFGVVAWGYKVDTDATGQDLTELAPVVEAISPMVYPSHFAEGFHGYEVPGDHPDIVAIGTKKAVDLVKSIPATTAIRPWVQAFPWKSPSFGSTYIADQIRESKNGGGVGWLAWNSGGEYGATFQALPTKKK